MDRLSPDIVGYTNISCGRFSSSEEGKYLNYIDDEFLSKPNMLIISDLLKKRILISLIELFNNAHTHGRCNFLYVSGKYFERQKKMCLTLCNIGTTIRANVNFFLNKQMKGHAAINWAVLLGNSTRIGNIPGGLGFSVIRNFLKVNEGKIQIISSNGMWEENKEGIFEQSLDDPFEGTIINLEFNIDNKSYILFEEIDLKTIF